MEKELHLGMLAQDVEFAKLAFEIDDFETMNIAGNRMMSDSLFGPNDEYAILGFFIKHTAMRFLNLKPRVKDADFSEAKSIGIEYVSTYSAFSPDTQFEAWDEFYKFNSRIDKIGESDIEKKAYKENLDIISSSSEYLIELLNKKREILCDPRNELIRILIGEFSRIDKVHGFSKSDAVVQSLFIALDRYAEYVAFQYLSVENNNIESFKKLIFPYIDRFASLDIKKIDLNIVNKLMIELIKGWRELFICYGEVRRIQSPTISEKPIKIPEDSKKKLSEVLGKALQKELKA